MSSYKNGIGVKTVHYAVPIDGQERLLSYGPFETYEELCDWRAKNGLGETHRQATFEVPVATNPEDYVSRRFLKKVVKTYPTSGDQWKVTIERETCERFSSDEEQRISFKNILTTTLEELRYPKDNSFSGTLVEETWDEA